MQVTFSLGQPFLIDFRINIIQLAIYHTLCFSDFTRKLWPATSRAQCTSDRPTGRNSFRLCRQQIRRRWPEVRSTTTLSARQMLKRCRARPTGEFYTLRQSLESSTWIEPVDFINCVVKVCDIFKNLFWKLLNYFDVVNLLHFKDERLKN